MPKFAHEALDQAAQSLFLAAGAPPEEATCVVRHLIESNLAGHDSHGFLRVPQYVNALQTGRVRTGAPARVLSETVATAVVDGQGGFGQVVAGFALNLAAAKARQVGVSAVTLRNSYHTGRIASYTLKLAERQLLGLMMVNAGGGGQWVAPFGGSARRIATNPISIAAPSGGPFPIVLDIATSVAPEGKIRDFYQRGQPLPEGWVMDAKGRPSTDASVLYSDPGGALLPFGGPAGYKGFGLGFMIDILAGALSGAGCCRPDVVAAQDGALIIAVDIERFVPLDTFRQQVAQLVEHVKSSPPAPGSPEVRVPGELEFREEQRRRREGIDIDERTWREVQQLAAKLDVPLTGALSAVAKPTAPLLSHPT
ncbi:MAG: Ldh family oxidoreductase [Verrucomicrobia bacterium]|nr:Ldh family oxidoreductase [Verrucomicrobiota bacterium]